MFQSPSTFLFLCLFLICSRLAAFSSYDTSSGLLRFPEEDFQHDYVQLKQGAELQEAGLHEKAIQAYQDLLNQLEEKGNSPSDFTLPMQARFHLAYAYFSVKNYNESLLILKNNISQESGLLSSQQERIRRHSLYLYALSLTHLKQDLSAKAAFLAYVDLATSPSSSHPLVGLTFHEEALFEIGLLDFLHGNIQEAALRFRSLTKRPLVILANLYLARIAQIQGNDIEAASILEPLPSQLAQDDPLAFELHYLQGKNAFNRRDYPQAIEHFTNALPAGSPEKTSWYPDTLTHLGWSHLRIADEAGCEPVRQTQALIQAENSFRQLLEIAPDENGYLALAQCYLSQAQRWKQPEYGLKAEEILSELSHFTSKESQAQALLLRAEAAPTYIARDQFYRQLITASQNSPALYAKGWYLYALNDFEHGQTLLASHNENAAQNAFERAEKAFGKAYTLLAEQASQQAGPSLKYQALSTSYSKTSDADLKAFQLLDELVFRLPAIWEIMENQDEVYYLHGYFASKLAVPPEQEKYLAISQQSLQAAASMPNNRFGDKALHHLAALYYQHSDYIKAEDTYLQLADRYPTSSLAAEAWLCAALCADELKKDPKIGKQRRQYAFEHFPQSPHTAEAYFTYYSYPEYIQGDKAAIKHLKHFIDHYHDTPFLIDAYFLMGLDYKRDRKTAEGKWIRKKSLTDAIDSLQKSEIFFDELSEKELIPAEKLDYYTAMRYRATFERALANLTIANDAQGAKRQIYLDYAEEVFRQLHTALQDRNNPHTKLLFQHNQFPLIEEESTFWLAQTYAKANKDEEASKILTDMRNRYQQLKINKGYYLARTMDELGNIAMRKDDFHSALQHFKTAEEANKGQALSTHQKLDLWIRESLCYRELKQFDDAILILSKVINDDAVSNLRLKAMYLRAETYELQKRPELARKQLESMVKKGGIWAKKAQDKLDKEYLNE